MMYSNHKIQVDIQDAASKLAGITSKYAPIHPTLVAWNDGKRGVSKDGQVSCYGPNITDANIGAKDNRPIVYMKNENWNETLGVTTADKVLLGADDTDKPLSLQDVLETMSERAAYMGVKSVNVNMKCHPQPVVVRFQHAFVPLAPDETEAEVAPRHYSYQTVNDNEPRNLLYVATPKGNFVHGDKLGPNLLLAHTKDGDEVKTHWFKAEESDNVIGEVSKAAPDRGAPKGKIGIAGMESSTNMFAIVSVPNKITPPMRGGLSGCPTMDEDDGGPVYRSLSARCGVARKANMEIGSEVGKANKMDTNIERPEDEPITVTFLSYNTIRSTNSDDSKVAVSRKDLVATVDEIDSMYSLCDGVGRLSELDVMLHKLTGKHMEEITHKRKIYLAQEETTNKFSFKPNAAASIA